MTPERWREVDAIFQAAREREPANGNEAVYATRWRAERGAVDLLAPPGVATICLCDRFDYSLEVSGLA
jgi:hypothetical protein